MMGELGLDVSGAAVARHYAGIIDGFVVDQTDPIPDPLQGVTFFTAATLMNTSGDRSGLAHAVLQAADALGGIAPVA